MEVFMDETFVSLELEKLLNLAGTHLGCYGLI